MNLSLANIDAFEWTLLSIQFVGVIVAVAFAIRATHFARLAQKAADKLKP